MSTDIFLDSSASSSEKKTENTTAFESISSSGDFADGKESERALSGITISDRRYGSGSILPSRTAFVSASGSRPARPGQLKPGIIEAMAGGSDPELLRELAHTSAAALLDRVHHSEDSAVVQRVLTLVDREGVDIIAELWSNSEPESLPGVLWRLYLLRSWMRRQSGQIAKLWDLGEPVVTSASAIVGVDTSPTEDDIARMADSILAGAFTGDFAVALERAAAFLHVVAQGLHIQARTQVAHKQRKLAAQSMHTGSNLMSTAKLFLRCATLWRNGKLE